MIVSPYDTRLSSFTSSVTMFYVEPSQTAISGGTPKKVTFATHSLPPSATAPAASNAPYGGVNGKRPPVTKLTLPTQSAVAASRSTPLMELPPEERRYWEEKLRVTCRLLCALVHYYKADRRRTQLKAPWRKKLKAPKASNGDNGVVGQPCSKLEKLTRSVRGRLVEAFSQERVDPLLEAVVECIETTWIGKA